MKEHYSKRLETLERLIITETDKVESLRRALKEAEADLTDFEEERDDIAKCIAKKF